jgi:2-phosphoglycerate kinase
MNTDIKNAKIVVIAGGSFHGKSLVALEVAARFNFSGVLTTDSIRNTLTILYPDKCYLSTSIYLLSESSLQKQVEEVSDVIKQMTAIYRNRGEHMVIEGVHFSDDFLRWTETQDFCRIFLDNLLSFKERILYKHATRSRLRLYDPVSATFTMNNITSANVENSSYVLNQVRITEIHDQLRASCLKYGFQVVEFHDIVDGITKASLFVEKWLSLG